jgi:hypothetical protein
MARPKKADNAPNRRDLTTIVQVYRADHACINLLVSAYSLNQSDVVRQLLYSWIENMPESESDLKSVLLKMLAKEKQLAKEKKIVAFDKIVEACNNAN